ncbi:MAG: DUF1552 domain-containing protein [Chitinophagaceae bacterium]|nr:DUF1552 domain-containing protein [Oligoflexus sp.]
MAISLNRRAVIKGVGAGLALPLLDCMMDSRGLLIGTAKGEDATAMKLRYFAFVIHNGSPDDMWAKTASNGSYTQGIALQPLNDAGLARDFNQIMGLTAKHLFNDTLVDLITHQAGQLGFLTGRIPKRIAPRLGAATGRSIDMVMGDLQGKPAIATTMPRTGQDRNVNTQMSWAADGQQSPMNLSPQELAVTLGILDKDGNVLTPGPVSVTTSTKQKNILDFLKDDANRLRAKLGAADKARLDQHLTSVAELQKAVVSSMTTTVSTKYPDAVPRGTPSDDVALDAMVKLITYAFVTDKTRSVSFDVGNATPHFVQRDCDDHEFSHLGGQNLEQKQYYIQEKIRYFAKFLTAFKNATEGGSNILYNSACIFGSDISDGDRHNLDNARILQAGNAGGKIVTGRMLDYPGINFNNFHVSMLKAMGFDNKQFGTDSTGPLMGLVS